MLMKNATKVRLKAGPDDGLEEGQFEAYASIFGNKDSYGDVVMPGAFTDTLTNWKDSGSNIPLLFGHNMSDPDFNLGHVMDAKEDDRGLLTLNQLDLENPKSAQTYRLIKGRRINQMSFAYDVQEGGWAKRQKDADNDPDDYEEIFELRKLKLYEVSVVPIGANQETEITAFKAAELAERALADGRLTQGDFNALLKSYHRIGDLLIKSRSAIFPIEASAPAPVQAQEPPALPVVKAQEPAPDAPVDGRKLAATIRLQLLEGEVQ
jgi:HK97 family phage prohead protease